MMSFGGYEPKIIDSIKLEELKESDRVVKFLYRLCDESVELLQNLFRDYDNSESLQEFLARECKEQRRRFESKGQFWAYWYNIPSHGEIWSPDDYDGLGVA
jgi:hypothetical protein